MRDWRRLLLGGVACIAALTAGTEIAEGRFDERSTNVLVLAGGLVVAAAIGAAVTWVLARARTREPEASSPLHVALPWLGWTLATLALVTAGVLTVAPRTNILDIISDGYVLLAAFSAGFLALGVAWGREFDWLFARTGEKSWTRWMLWPSLGALGATFLARDLYPLWGAMALTVVTLFTIAGHALVMGQRTRPKELGGDAVAPNAQLRIAVTYAPMLTAAGVAAVLAIAGIVDLALS